MSQDRIEREILIEASRERVWAVLTEAKHVAGWFGDGAGIDLRPGGKASFTWSAENMATFRAVIARVEPPSFFSYRWSNEVGAEPAPGGSTLVEFTLIPQGANTLLHVVETGFASLNTTPEEQAKSAADNTEGWTSELAELKEYAERPAA